MACLSLHYIEQLIIWLIVLGGVYALINLLIPLVIGPLNQVGAILVKAISIVLWVVIAIFIVRIIFDLISCLLGGAPIGHGLTLGR
jgi:hypothetical protein